MKLSMRILSAASAIILLSGIATGCKKKNSDIENPVSDSSSSSMAEQPQSDDAAFTLDTLDNTCHGWGQGTIVDEHNCPVSCNDFNRRYQDYHVRFGGDQTVGKTIYLTFDEGYENGYTAKILDVLKEKQCPAVFFITMDYAKSQPELVQRMIDEGHVIGNHSTTHPSMPSLTISKMQDEITTLHDYIAETFHYQMSLFRPPKGEFSTRSLAVTQDLGYTSVFWSFAYKDWVADAQPEPNASLQKMVSCSHDGAIYLLHAVSSTNTAVLGNFIDQMRNNGYKFSTALS